MKDETKVTIKYQTTIPKEIRKYLNLKPGKEVRWHIVKKMVVVDTHEKIPNPVKFLTSQIRLDVDAVKLVKESREDFG
jgi:bifunctional DNA-binding transcriptional regulator/antitoxin component of YhaV-PrlF toxin-antitoxin module